MNRDHLSRGMSEAPTAGERAPSCPTSSGELRLGAEDRSSPRRRRDCLTSSASGPRCGPTPARSASSRSSWPCPTRSSPRAFGTEWFIRRGVPSAGEHRPFEAPISFDSPVSRATGPTPASRSRSCFGAGVDRQRLARVARGPLGRAAGCCCHHRGARRSRRRGTAGAQPSGRRWRRRSPRSSRTCPAHVVQRAVRQARRDARRRRRVVRRRLVRRPRQGGVLLHRAGGGHAGRVVRRPAGAAARRRSRPPTRGPSSRRSSA